MHRQALIQEDLAQIAAQPLPWQQLRGQHLLITGASGFIGGYLLELLSYLNETDASIQLQITALVRSAERFYQRFPHLQGRDDISLIVADLSDGQNIEIGRSVDNIIHCASEASPRYYLEQPASTISVNTLGTWQLLQLARRHHAGFLFLSSGAIYGQSELEVFAENDYGVVDPLDERACYSEGKRAGEAMCMAFFRQYQLPAKIARVSHTYGPGLELEDGRVFTDFMADALAGRDIEIKGNPRDARPFCYITDMIEGLLRIVLLGQPGEAYNIGADRQISIAELAQLLCGISEHPIQPSLVNTQAPQHRLRSSGYFNIDKIRQLGWQCRTTPEQGFERMYQYYSSL